MECVYFFQIRIYHEILRKPAKVTFHDPGGGLGGFHGFIHDGQVQGFYGRFIGQAVWLTRYFLC